MSLLTISFAVLGISLLLLALSAVRNKARRDRAINAAKERTRTRKIIATIQPIYKVSNPAEAIVYDTSSEGLEVSDLSEEQAIAIREIFETENHTKYIKKSENWASTDRMPL